MLKDLTNVIKARWPEMVLITGFMAITMFLVEQLNATAAAAVSGGASKMTMSESTSFLFSMVSMFFFVLFLTLYLGFLATLNVNPTIPHTPSLLVSIGRIFFWRALRLQILIMLYYFSLATLIFIPIKFLFFRNTPIEEIPQWTSYISVVVAFSVLVKPLLLILPIMICKNLVVLPAVKFLKEYRLSDIKILPVIFIGGLLVTGALTILQDTITAKPIILNVIFAVKSILSSLVTLLTGIMGIWFVAGRRFGVFQQQEETEETDI